MADIIAKATDRLVEKVKLEDPLVKAAESLSSLIDPKAYVGEVYSLGYDEALVQIHDFHRQQVGGIPALSFLVATRIAPGTENLDVREEDSSVILLRVIDQANLPNSDEALRVRVENAQRVSGELDKTWDHQDVMDATTHNILSYAGVRCRVLGTFYIADISEELGEKKSNYALMFGSDLSNYYPNRGLKVFKPRSAELEKIVNYRDPRTHQEERMLVKVGEVRYASTNRPFQQISGVPVSITPTDLLGQKTALFGMTRTGKSNTTKIILKSIFKLRWEKNLKRIGQVVFDPNGEYANENVQDNNNALKNVWKLKSGTKKEDEVVTYGLNKHKNDPDRKLMLINFYSPSMMQTGKEIIDLGIEDKDSQFLRNFKQVRFDKPVEQDFENQQEFFTELYRFERRALVYRTLLKKAGFKIPKSYSKPKMKLGKLPFFNQALIEAMKAVDLPKNESKKQNLIHTAAEVLALDEPSWDALASAFEGLFNFLSTDSYTNFNSEAIRNSSSGESWAEADLARLLEMFAHSKGIHLIGRFSVQHSEDVSTDFAEDIYADLVKGKLVIVDQSTGDSDLNKEVAERVMQKIFRSNFAHFREGSTPPEILVYVEEAHNLLPPGSEMDLENVWVRAAKEGAKCKIGIVYATQEVSSIQRNILKNTANWFIGHLNNTDETKELTKFYDFEDFQKSIMRAQDKGFLRIKTLSNPFIVPAQIQKFTVEN